MTKRIFTYRDINIEDVTEQTIRTWIKAFKEYGGYDGLYDDVLSVIIGYRKLNDDIVNGVLTKPQGSEALIDFYRSTRDQLMQEAGSKRQLFLLQFCIEMHHYLLWHYSLQEKYRVENYKKL